MRIPDFNYHRILDKTSSYMARTVMDRINIHKRYCDWNESPLLDNHLPDDENRFVNNFLQTYYEGYVSEPSEPLSNKAIFIDESVDNCEYVNRFVLGLNYVKGESAAVAGMASFNVSNVICIYCEIPCKKSKNWVHNFYLRLVSSIRHELQHSYQSMFLSGTPLTEVNYEVSRLSVMRMRDDVLSSERVYLIDLKVEKEARIKQWKIIATKTHNKWENVTFEAMELREKTLVDDFGVSAEDANKFIAEVVDSHIKFNNLYRHCATYLQAVK